MSPEKLNLKSLAVRLEVIVPDNVNESDLLDNIERVLRESNITQPYAARRRQIMENGRIRRGLVGLTGSGRLVMVVDVDSYWLRLVSLPDQPNDVIDDFYGSLIEGQRAFRVSAGLWIAPVDLETLTAANKAVVFGQSFPPLGALEVGYNQPKDEDAPAKARVAKPDAEKRTRVKTDGLIRATGKSHIVPALGREPQLQTIVEVAQDRPRPLDELVASVIAHERVRGKLSEGTATWLVKQLIKHGILEVAA